MTKKKTQNTTTKAIKNVFMQTTRLKTKYNTFFNRKNKIKRRPSNERQTFLTSITID